jgi:Ca2+-binding RTX toxin-like protein
MLIGAALALTFISTVFIGRAEATLTGDTIQCDPFGPYSGVFVVPPDGVTGYRNRVTVGFDPATGAIAVHNVGHSKSDSLDQEKVCADGFHLAIQATDNKHGFAGVTIAGKAYGPFPASMFALVVGSDGPDHLYGHPGADRLGGGPGPDALHSGAGVDKLNGGSGSDVLFPGSRGDHVDAGAGADTISARDGDADEIDCGPGRNDIAKVDRIDTTTQCETVKYAAA